MSAEDLDKFQSNLRAVLGFIKYSSDRDALDAFLLEEDSLHDLDIEAARVIGVCTNTEIDIDDNSEVIDVCKAVQDMIQEGREKARIETLCVVVKNAMESFHLNMKDAMDGLKVSKEDQDILRKMI